MNVLSSLHRPWGTSLSFKKVSLPHINGMFGSKSIGAGHISFYLINKHGLFGLGLDGSVKFGLGMGLKLGYQDSNACLTSVETSLEARTQHSMQGSKHARVRRMHKPCKMIDSSSCSTQKGHFMSIAFQTLVTTITQYLTMSGMQSYFVMTGTASSDTISEA